MSCRGHCVDGCQWCDMSIAEQKEYIESEGAAKFAESENRYIKSYIVKEYTISGNGDKLDE